MAFVSALPLTAHSAQTRVQPLRHGTPCKVASRRTPRAVFETSRSTASDASTANLSSYEQLTALTTIVEDTGDIETIRAHSPFAATTNPSLVAAAADMPKYAGLIPEAVSYAKSFPPEKRLAAARNKLFVLFGCKILDAVHPDGDVSTEVDARLSFDAEAQIETAREIIRLYEEAGVDRKRVLIKLATTWEGVEACRVLEAEGIRTNMTLLFSLPQAAAAAEAGAYLISPFVGRIMDWHKAKTGEEYLPQNDPGVASVRAIYDYYKCHDYKTIVMGASFRNLGEILELAGCDRLTIAPKYISALQESKDKIDVKLSPPLAERCTVDKLKLDEKQFRWMMNEDPMATEKLAEGIRKFAVDLVKLDAKLEEKMAL